MKFRPRAARIHDRRLYGAPVCTVADYLRETQPAEYAVLCVIAGIRDYASMGGQTDWQIGINEPRAYLERLMKQAPRSAKEANA